METTTRNLNDLEDGEDMYLDVIVACENMFGAAETASKDYGSSTAIDMHVDALLPWLYSQGNTVPSLYLHEQVQNF